MYGTTRVVGLSKPCGSSAVNITRKKRLNGGVHPVTKAPIGRTVKIRPGVVLSPLEGNQPTWKDWCKDKELVWPKWQVAKTRAGRTRMKAAAVYFLATDGRQDVMKGEDAKAMCGEDAQLAMMGEEAKASKGEDAGGKS